MRAFVSIREVTLRQVRLAYKNRLLHSLPLLWWFMYLGLYIFSGSLFNSVAVVIITGIYNFIHFFDKTFFYSFSYPGQTLFATKCRVWKEKQQYCTLLKFTVVLRRRPCIARRRPLSIVCHVTPSTPFSCQTLTVHRVRSTYSAGTETFFQHTIPHRPLAFTIYPDWSSELGRHHLESQKRSCHRTDAASTPASSTDYRPKLHLFWYWFATRQLNISKALVSDGVSLCHGRGVRA